MNEIMAQLVALLTFFAFPAIQYILLKRYSRKEGAPELWYLPQYGFRLVMRNNPGTKTLSEIRYRALIREVIPPGAGASVVTWNDRLLHERDDFFLFPHADQVLLSFQLERGESGLIFVYTDKLGNAIERITLSDRAVVIADYVANVENLFNFDVKLAKRVEITMTDLFAVAEVVAKSNVEQECRTTRVRDVG